MPRKVNPGTIRVGSGRNADKSLDSNSFTTPVVNSSLNSMRAHVTEPKSSHTASSISVSSSGDSFNSDNVQGVLREVSALVPLSPPNVGEFSKVLSFSGIPDWGVLKARDAGQGDRGDITFPDSDSPNEDLDIYPIFHFVPKAADSVPPFEVLNGGNDPETDLTFNVFDGIYTGGGTGTSHFGGFPRDVIGNSNDRIAQSARILPTEGMGVKSFLLSGSLYPADRGVLALFYWPPEAGKNEFLLQDLTDRVVCAISLGQGLVAQGGECDGDPGGIFTGSLEDPFTFPGQATGQYDLLEIHTAQVGGSGSNLPSPFDIPQPAAGQVRLGVSLDAGEPLVAGGIPILGGTTVSTGGGDDGNFLRYRLPYLNDYSTDSGLGFTPLLEKSRYYSKPPIALNPLEDLTQAGDYNNFVSNFWSFQVSRYRHKVTFPTGLPNPPTPRDVGNYVLVHFKKERDFELYARDGIFPNTSSQCYQVYSSSLTNWEDPEDPENLVNLEETATGYHVLRAMNYEDPEALDPVSIGTVTYDYNNSPNEAMPISGVYYFTPGVTASAPWTIKSMTYRATGYWENSFLLTELDSTGAVTEGLGGPNPAMLYLGRYGYEPGKITHAAETDFDGQIKPQRIEFGYDKLDETSSHGDFSLLNSPQDVDEVAFQLVDGQTPIGFLGDVSLPQFSTDSQVRLYLRSPLGFQDPTTSTLPVEGTIIPPADGKTILFYSSVETLTVQGTGSYGNVTVAPAGPFPSPARSNLETALKDYQERFLDEVYRYIFAELQEIDATYDAGIGRGNLTGPGLPFGPPSPHVLLTNVMNIPVRIGTDPETSFQDVSWIQQGVHFLDLNDFESTYSAPVEAQVAGLPDRNPPLDDGVTFSAPSSGVLIYPQDDYTANVRPSVTDGDLIGTFSQPDYASITSTTEEANYLRMFDVAMFRSAKSQDLNGQPFFSIIVRGLKLEDFAYVAPGPGTAKIAIMIKVPGYTTWMDLGRRDQTGPSKQDANKDGAGCQIFGSETFEARDPETGVWFSQVRVNVGPAANLFQNYHNETPVFVRAVVKSSGSDLNFKQNGPDGSTNDVRGLIGLEIVREDKPEVLPIAPPPP